MSPLGLVEVSRAGIVAIGRGPEGMYVNQFLQILGGGLVAAILSPLLLSFLQQRVIWRAQRQTEIKAKSFDDAMLALAMYETDALDVQLQENKPTGGGLQPVTNFRQETRNQMQKSLALIEAFFDQETFRAYNDALSSSLSLQTIPNVEYFQRRTKAIRLLADELGLSQPWWRISR